MGMQEQVANDIAQTYQELYGTKRESYDSFGAKMDRHLDPIYRNDPDDYDYDSDIDMSTVPCSVLEEFDRSILGDKYKEKRLRTRRGADSNSSEAQIACNGIRKRKQRKNTLPRVRKHRPEMDDAIAKLNGLLKPTPLAATDLHIF